MKNPDTDKEAKKAAMKKLRLQRKDAVAAATSIMKIQRKDIKAINIS